MLPEHYHETKSRPPLTQFTIALLLIKSKPSGLKIEDYIADLRLHIKQTPEPLFTAATERHVDAALFWRDAFTKSQETQTALRIRIAELEQIHREYTKACLKPGPSIPNGRETRSKRKAPTIGLDVPEDQSGKTARTANSCSPRHKQHIEDFNISENLSHGIGSYSFARAFLQQVFNLQDLRSLPNPSARNLASTLDQALLVITQLAKSAHEAVAERVSSPPSSQTDTSEHNFDHIRGVFADLEQILSPQLRVMKSFLPLLLGNFDELGHLQDGALLQRSLIGNFTATFEIIFQHICELANTFAAHTKIPNGPALALQIHQGHVWHVLPKHPSFLLTLCDFGLGLVNGLDCAKAAHSNVMEGCLYIVLREIGYRLRESVFGPSGHNSEDTSSTESDSLDSRNVIRNEAAKRNPAADSLYMIYMLERIPSLQRAFLQHVQPQMQMASHFTSQSTSDSLPTLQDSKSGKLINGASLHFQHTLLKAVFGEKQAADFEPSLSKPQESEIFDRGEFQESQENNQNWFKREVWRLVGWEVLRSKLDTECSKRK